MSSNRRDHLIDTALDLFYREGFHATGIDRILSKSGVAKMTLYNHFKSKDELILAALRRRDETFRNWFMRAVERRARSPRERLLALFDVLGDWTREPGFSGCMFINAAAEYGDCDHPVHAIAAEHKRLMIAYIRGLAEQAGADAPERLAERLDLLMEGVIVIAQLCGKADAADTARGAAEVLIREATAAA